MVSGYAVAYMKLCIHDKCIFYAVIPSSGYKYLQVVKHFLGTSGRIFQ